jgi:retinol dehydrogenase-12
MLLPLLLKTSKQAEEEGQKPRVIFTTSRRHAMALPAGGIAFVTLKTPQLDTPPLSRYTRSKLANILYARQFALRYPSIVSVAMHPGEVATRLFSKGAVGEDPQIEYLAREVAPKMCGGAGGGSEWVVGCDRGGSGEWEVL